PRRARRPGRDRGALGWEHGDPFRGALLEIPRDRAGVELPGGRCPPDPPKFSAWGADASRGQQGLGLGKGGRAPWRTAHRRALRSHFCGALSSRRRGQKYQDGTETSSRRSSLAARIPWKTKKLTTGHFYCGQMEDISIVVRHIGIILLDNPIPLSKNDKVAWISLSRMSWFADGFVTCPVGIIEKVHHARRPPDPGCLPCLA